MWWLGQGMRWLLLFCCFYEILMSNHSCLSVILGAVCIAERQPGTGERKPIPQTLRLRGNSLLPLKQSSPWRLCAFRLKPGKNRGSFHVGFLMLELALQQNRITSRFSLKQLSGPVHWHWSWIATAFSTWVQERAGCLLEPLFQQQLIKL